MNEPLFNDKTIQRYIDGEMPDAEKKQFEAEMAQDAGLREAVERLQLAVRAVQYYAIADQVKLAHRVKLSGTAPAFTKPAGRMASGRVVRMALMAAASVILVIAAAGGFYMYQLSPDAVYAESYVPYNLSASRSADSVQSSVIEKAYTTRAYAEVIQEGNRQQTLSPKEQFLVGLAYLQQQQFADAIKQLSNLVNNQQAGAYKQDAEYYLALAYLKTKDYSHALPLMQAIRNNPGHLYHQQVTGKTINDVRLLKWKQ